MKTNKLYKSHFMKQSIFLLVSSVFTIILAFIFNILITKNISVENYGIYRYIVNFQLFLIPIVMLGWQYSIGRLIAINKNKKEQEELVGFSLLIASICGLIGFLVACIYIITVKYLDFDASTSKLLFITSFFIVFPLSISFFENILQGLNKIKLLSISKILVPFLQILFVLPWIIINKELSIYMVLTGYFFSMALVLIVINFALNVKLKNVNYWREIVKNENKLIGFHVYVGALFGITALQGVIFFTGNITPLVEYGYLSLAITLASPIAIIPTVLGTVLYKKNANSNKIDNKILLLCVTLSILSLIFYLIFLEVLFNKVYDESYSRSLKMTQYLTLGYVMNGLGNFFNKFLGARSKGKEIRKGSVYNGILTLIIAGVTIPFFGIWGTVSTIVLSSAIFLFFMIFYYYKTIRE